jgi:hypothetical protein
MNELQQRADLSSKISGADLLDELEVTVAK